MSAEKRARLRSNPVKVRFAEEVVVNGHTQVKHFLWQKKKKKKPYQKGINEYIFSG